MESRPRTIRPPEGSFSRKETPFLSTVCATMHPGFMPGPEAGKSLPHGDEVVAVALLHGPAEGEELVPERLEGHDVLRGPLHLPPVPVHKEHKIVQGEVGGGHGGLPENSLLELPVAHTAEDRRNGCSLPQGEGEAVGEAEPLAEGLPGASTPGVLRTSGNPWSMAPRRR